MNERSSDSAHQGKKVSELEKQNADLSRKLRGDITGIITMTFFVNLLGQSYF